MNQAEVKTMKNDFEQLIIFSKVNLAGSFFQKCVFKDCIFDRTHLDDAKFINWNFKNCQIINYRSKDIELTEKMIIYLYCQSIVFYNMIL